MVDDADAPLTDEELAAMEARSEAATPGPWRWEGDYPQGACPHDAHNLAADWGFVLADHGPDLVSNSGVVGQASGGLDMSQFKISDADADFIAHARSDVPRLIADLRAARAEVERLRKRAEDAEASLRRAAAIREERERCNRRPCTCGHHRDLA